ncbi:MAG: arginine--tRNA ligase [Alteromonadaceae bacterium]|nr:arginine--tRNA ligase [Alteromonadaceae bacterium]|tara:strand:- start:23 stop:1777 length:1755 start_codon:yes stop_codon:yes gene_type:complete
MKETIAQLVEQALSSLKASGTLPADFSPPVVIENTRDKAHGDFACNVAMVSAKAARKPPRQIAEAVIEALPTDPAITRVEIAGPGFINFFISDATSLAILETILTEGEEYGRSNAGEGKPVQVEFVSANPTGPLHVGHGRGAAYGATVADLLEAVGYAVQREYYVNDAGRQMSILAVSVWLRYLTLCGETLVFPSNGYKGEYINDIAAQLRAEVGERFRHPASAIFADITPDEPAGGDKELHVDALIARCKSLLGDSDYEQVFAQGLNAILADIREDLGEFGVHYQRWFSERTLKDDVEKAIKRLSDNGHLYEKEGALWFRSTNFGDDKDRVIRRENGETTYFASDIAYHLNKFERGYRKVINIWGADHHGYITRVKASLTAMGLNADDLQVQLVQFAILYRGGERLQMSTRSGSFVTLRELRDEVGNDAARFFYVTRKAEQHMDFDLDLAKSQSKDNPVYYIQYAHARICSMLAKLTADGVAADAQRGLAQLARLELEEERDLANRMALYPEIVLAAAEQLEPHQLTHYLRELAGQFHTYYNSHKVLGDDPALRDARVMLSLAVQQVIANGLGLLGVSAPQSM